MLRHRAGETYVSALSWWLCARLPCFASLPSRCWRRRGRQRSRGRTARVDLGWMDGRFGHIAIHIKWRINAVSRQAQRRCLPRSALYTVATCHAHFTRWLFCFALPLPFRHQWRNIAAQLLRMYLLAHHLPLLCRIGAAQRPSAWCATRTHALRLACAVPVLGVGGGGVSPVWLPGGLAAVAAAVAALASYSSRGRCTSRVRAI